MRNLIITSAAVILVTALSYFGFVQYVKLNLNRTIQKVATTNQCHFTYKDLKLESFSFPFGFNFAINKPELECNLYNSVKQENAISNILFDVMYVNFQFFGNNINIRFAVIDNTVSNGAVSKLSCFGNNLVSIDFSQDVFSIIRGIRSGKFAKEMISGAEISLDGLSCKEDGSDNTKLEATVLLNAQPDMEGNSSDLKLLMDVVFFDDSNNNIAGINTDLSWVIANNNSSKFSCTKFDMYTSDFAASMNGDLNFGGRTINGRLVIKLQGYKSVISLIDKLGYPEGVISDMIHTVANYVDDNEFSITLQDIGDEFYVGRVLLQELIEKVRDVQLVQQP